MQADSHTLAQLMSLAGLVAGTVEYAHVLRRRVGRRADAARRDSEEAGLQALVRIEVAKEQAAWVRRHHRLTGRRGDA